MVTHGERIASARKVIEHLLRARKAVRLYPDSSPLTVKAADDLHAELLNLLSFQDKISFEIRQDVILFELEEVFQAASRENNIPFFLFRDGVREVTFKKGLTRDEVLGFIHVISGDWEREGAGDDVVTKMWEHDFKHIRCVVYEPDLFVTREAGESAQGRLRAGRDFSAELVRAYSDAVGREEDIGGAPDSIEFSDDDLLSLRKDIENSRLDRTGKLLAVVLEMFLLAETPEEYGELENIMKKAVEYALAKRKIDVLADFFIKVKAAYMDSSVDPRFKRNLSNVFSYFSTQRFLIRVGSMLDDGLRLDQETFDKLTLLLDRRSIPVLIMLLGYLDTISARKTVVNLLAAIGHADVHALTDALHDGRWYVVRNVVIALRRIGDKQAKNHLLKIVCHKDARVRREAVKALAEIGGGEAIGLLRRALDDADRSVRQFSVISLSNLNSNLAKKLLLEKVESRRFLNLDYEEKKEYYRALLRYNDKDVLQLLGNMLLKPGFFRKARNDENKVAIAYNVGLNGTKDFLPYLYRLRDSKNELLRRTVGEAIRKLEYGS